ncbi:MAG: sodium-dependent transporter [Ruminococcaceae bacterium]|nr:sodium-dependent transporter [Oscillospiraceae bacterium]
MNQREKLSSRLGFILISAGCAIGLGNVWRFPFITGQYGGAAFVILYLFFLVIFGLPIMAMEFSVGRASGASVATSFKKLEPKGTKWHIFGYFAMVGNYLLMMFYTTVCGWMFYYFVKMLKGDFVGLSPTQVADAFSGMVSDPVTLTIWMVISVLLGFGICALGLQKGVEKITKVMMSSLFVILLILVVRAVTLPGAKDGLKFYLMPDFKKMFEAGAFEVISAAMGQAFFTLSIGIGSMAIFGSYIDKDRALMGESLNILALDTSVALLSGLIIFPACFAFGVNADSGPSLVFITLPNIFNNMAGGRIWGTLFFAFMSFAALSTVIAVFENIISFAMDLWNFSRKKAVIINIFLVIILSIPCVLGFNVLSGITPLGAGSNIMDLEDFIVSNNLLPIGSLVYLFFCVTKYGWGWDNFIKEVNTGKGIKFPKWLRIYVTYILPIVVLFLFVQGYASKFLG